MDGQQGQEEAEAVFEFYSLLTKGGINQEAALELTRAWMEIKWGKPFSSFSINGNDVAAVLWQKLKDL